MYGRTLTFNQILCNTNKNTSTRTSVLMYLYSPRSASLHSLVVVSRPIRTMENHTRLANQNHRIVYFGFLHSRIVAILVYLTGVYWYNLDFVYIYILQYFSVCLLVLCLDFPRLYQSVFILPFYRLYSVIYTLKRRKHRGNSSAL